MLFENGFKPATSKALWEVVSLGYTKCVHWLLTTGGVNINATNGRKTMLQHAAMGCHNDAILLLLQYGADPNTNGDDYYSPLRITLGHFDDIDVRRVVLMLMRHGARLRCGEEERMWFRGGTVDIWWRDTLRPRLDAHRAVTCVLLHTIRKRYGRDIAECIARAYWARRWDGLV